MGRPNEFQEVVSNEAASQALLNGISANEVVPPGRGNGDNPKERHERLNQAVAGAPELEVGCQVG